VATFFIVLGVMLAVCGGMAIGVIFSNKPLKGSCGGVGKALQEDDYTCEICGDDEDKCNEINSEESGEERVGSSFDDKVNAALGYDVSKKN
tara:strand:- start:10420 stop:10692 length:273 start_codon:yes stop_codon:yes gene_type:complete